VLLEKLKREEEALPVWEKLYERLQAFRRPSFAFLAECQLHRARILENLKADKQLIIAALKLAGANMKRCDRKLEMPGPFENFDALSEAIQKLQKKYSPAAASRLEALKK